MVRSKFEKNPDHESSPETFIKGREIEEDPYLQYFNTLVDMLQVLELIFDQDGRAVDYYYLRVNPAFEKLVGKTAEQLVGKRVKEIFTVVEDHWLKTYEKVAETGIAIHYENYGEELDKFYDVYVWKITDKQVGVTFRDITEQKKTNEELQRIQRLESIGTLAGGIAHEFNNILSIIIGSNDLLVDHLPETSLAREYSKDIHLAGLRAKDIVKHILTFSRQDQSIKKPIDISLTVTESLQLIKSTTPTNIEIREKISSDSLLIWGDSTQINQVLINLCNNASDALPVSGGRIDIELCSSEIHQDTAPTNKLIGPGRYIKLLVRDNGVGIEKEIIERIFEPFFTTKNIGNGSGIGLAVVHGIVEQHGGFITCDSTKDKGTTFTLLIPVYEGATTEELAEEYVFSGKGEHVLYVDDELTIAKLGKRQLESLGYDVFSTTDSYEALKLIKTNPDRFDLVISDMAMPNMPGDILITKILALRPEMPTIICTGFSARVSDAQASTIGIKAYLYKPVMKTELAKTVRRVLDEAKSHS